ncbi:MULTISPECIES: hypothetical protein [unclassified Nocardia]|uniref:hypothetical protein n=1 Tax=unclassified Nocardia TaxID=2637762 RepID=UPI001CE433A2|nr:MULTISPECIES: hypothetical protein [unclassified Nocardia]
MSTDVWMVVESCAGPDDQVVTVRYVERIGKVVVATGSGRLFMTVPIAKELLHELAVAVMDGQLDHGSKSGAGVWITPSWFVSADAAVELWAERRAA